MVRGLLLHDPLGPGRGGLRCDDPLDGDPRLVDPVGGRVGVAPRRPGERAVRVERQVDGGAGDRRDDGAALGAVAGELPLRIEERHALRQLFPGKDEQVAARRPGEDQPFVLDPVRGSRNEEFLVAALLLHEFLRLRGVCRRDGDGFYLDAGTIDPVRGRIEVASCGARQRAAVAEDDERLRPRKGCGDGAVIGAERDQVPCRPRKGFGDLVGVVGRRSRPAGVAGRDEACRHDDRERDLCEYGMPISDHRYHE
ncbi:hypothetical protein DSECCO2_623200 [anaerobic digester metagenome]